MQFVGHNCICLMTPNCLPEQRCIHIHCLVALYAEDTARNEWSQPAMIEIHMSLTDKTPAVRLSLRRYAVPSAAALQAPI